MSFSEPNPIGRFGKYLVYSEGCQGGMGTIYRARDSAFDALSPDSSEVNSPHARWVAIKCLRLSALDGGTDVLRAFGEEALAMKRLEHANVVRLIDYGKEKGAPFLVMEWVHGKSLRETLTRSRKSESPIPLRLCLHIIQQAALGLQYIHRKGVIHRDLTPHNVMVGFDGSIKIIDFGIAKTMDSQDATRTGLIKGKPGYLSPEQVIGLPLTSSVDVFTLGILLWETLTGGRLFKGNNTAETLKKIADCKNHIRPPSRYRPEISSELDQVVLRALDPDPAVRYASAIDLHDDLARTMASGLELAIDHLDLEKVMGTLFGAEVAELRVQSTVGLRTIRAAARNQPEELARKDAKDATPELEQVTGDANAPESCEVAVGSTFKQDIKAIPKLELAISADQLHALRYPGQKQMERLHFQKATDQSNIFGNGKKLARRSSGGKKSKSRSRNKKQSGSLVIPLLFASLGVAFATGVFEEPAAKRLLGGIYSLVSAEVSEQLKPSPKLSVKR